ncbi:hypothetical protein BDV93DRAFT_509824 [Ceratobasidium sp. AG-I]|nr:hypothetical protein BDV93DRAFT_509824 [Ceratobasidium sp. AG-I]
MAHRNTEQQQRINGKKTTRKKRLNTDARLITGDEEMALREEALAETSRQAEEAVARARQLEEEEARRQTHREASAASVTWTAGWRRKKKAELQDLAFVLGVSMEGTNRAITERIETHLRRHPHLAGDHRFRALFEGLKDVRALSQPPLGPDASHN